MWQKRAKRSILATQYSIPRVVEDVDRLSRLTGNEWEKLKKLIRERQVRVVTVNVPTTWQHLAPAHNERDTETSLEAKESQRL
jgi:RNase H-fold protein (predicted Holliday junction resolvase)